MSEPLNAIQEFLLKRGRVTVECKDPENNDSAIRLQHMLDFYWETVKFQSQKEIDENIVNWLNFLGISVDEEATCLTRQIMNSATYANFPGGVYEE